MTKCLYEELIDKKLNPIKLPLELAYTIPYDAKVDRQIGSYVITFKAIKIERN